MRYAAFIICFERPLALIKYIDVLRSQSEPPEYILIIDNSLDDSIDKLNLDKKYAEVNYFKTGYNAGPAGGSKLGLKKLQALNYQWIFWGDDDNPPRDNQVCSELFICKEKLERQGIVAGIIGGKGGMFNKWTGTIRSLSNKQLKAKDIIEVDMVPGGHGMLINTHYLNEKTYPEEKLFFAFEDLDICLKFKKQGAGIFVDAKSWYKKRQLDKNGDDSYRYVKKSGTRAGDLRRQYFSSRNLLFILKENRYFFALAYNIFKIVIKSLWSFRYGFKYGKKFIYYHKKALIDFFNDNYILNIPLNK
ncbi:GT2 family glycosyltransferase [Salegentibacter sp. 24]|uniref:glycosyltransferase n=1 Tax=Salegentibacter sp. 24 TaxID=2183986 RepID=UPI001060C9FD|nr:glycosyltransferase [Salegentibacter sp. 24]TDN82171.1 GT2 family glycosyltransferase [Salegentibacter sp. 24]